MKKTKKITLCALLASLGVVIMYLGAFFEVLDMSVAAIASLIILFCLAEFGLAASLSVYAVMSVISFLILPQKWVAFYFVFFFGLMPITKRLFEKVGYILSWVLKIAAFNAELFLFYFITSRLGFFEENELSTMLALAALVMLNAVFILLDILYGRLYRIYLARYRKRIEKFLK